MKTLNANNVGYFFSLACVSVCVCFVFGVVVLRWGIVADKTAMTTVLSPELMLSDAERAITCS